MRDPQRIETLMALIRQLWLLQPDSRFNQLIYNLQRDYSRTHGDVGLVRSDDEDFSKTAFDLFSLEDDSFIAYLEMRLREAIAQNEHPLLE